MSASNFESIITTDDSKLILKNCFEDSEVKYVSHELVSLRGNVEGYLSDHFSLDITYEEDNEVKSKLFFVKVVLQTESFLKIFSEAMDAFSKEVFFYTKFVKKIEELKYFKRIFPKCYLAKENVLVLENLSDEGFKTNEKLKFFNVEQCQNVLKILAHYHAYGIVYEENKSKSNNHIVRLNEEFPKEFEDKFFGEYKASPTAKFVESSLLSVIGLIEEIPNDILPEKNRFLQLMDKNFSDLTNANDFKSKYRRTCVHGDLWSHNIMFKHENNKIIDCRLIDFQILNYSLPAHDVELFFYGNTNASFRSKHKNELLKYYYECFSEVLAKNEIEVSDIMSYKDFKETCILVSPEAKVQAVSDLSILYFPDEFHQEAAANPECFKTVLIDDRSNYTLKLYHDNSTYRHIITSELIDLLHVLEAKENFLNSM